MTQRELSAAEAERHNIAFRRGCALVGNRLRIGDRRTVLLTWFGRRRLRQAIKQFEEALQVNPCGWPSMWYLGKIHQRLGEHAEALAWFRRSHELKPDQPDVAREAGLEALEVGDFSGAETFFKSAIDCNPNDPGHLANLALSQVLLGDVEGAARSAHEATTRNPGDRVSKIVVRIVDKVRLGECPVPTSMKELQRLASRRGRPTTAST